MSAVVFFSSCALDSAGRPDPFFLQELPWLRRHFDRVLLVSYYGLSEPTEDRPARLEARTPAHAAIRARFRAVFSRPMWRELIHLLRDRHLTPTAAAKLYLFAVRGYKLHYWAETLALGAPGTTLYSYWMSYDGFAAALCKRAHPSARAIARGHAFDVDIARNPMNPYLMKGFMARWLDALYPISQLARRQLLQCASVPEGKLRVVGMGSAGESIPARHAPPYFADRVLRVVSCAAVVPIKRVPMLADALAQYGEPAEWLHIGGGEGQTDLIARASSLPAGVRWEITGQVDSERVRALYAERAFDVFVNTSANEGVPVSIMEALRFGIPVIAPDLGGIPELVDDTVGALYPPEGGARAVADALSAFAALPRERVEAMREAAQRRWDERCRADRLLPLLFEKGESA